MPDTNCPYCAADVDICHDDGYGYQEDVIYSQYCDNCGKQFAYTTSIHFYYDTKKADCLNGGEHNYKPRRSYPNCYPDWVECVDCGHEIKGRYDPSVFKRGAEP